MFSCSIEGPRNFLMMFGLSLGLSLPAGRSNPRIRFLASAKDIVESQEFVHLEMVLLLSESANQEIESDEEGSDNILNEECLPDEVCREVEIHGEAFEDEITEK